MGCVYVAENQVNGKKYVGWAVSLRRRKLSHRLAAVKGSPLVFYHAIRKYGWEAFKWKVLKTASDKDELKLLEKVMIKRLGTRTPNGYNMTDGGDGFSGEHSEETKAKIRLAASAKRPEVREKISQALTGRQLSDEHKLNLRRNAIGRKPSTLALLRSANLRRGVPLTQEHLAKIRESLSKIENPAKRAEVRAKISEAMTGRVMPEETKNKIRARLLGRKNGPPSEETRARIAASVARTWHNRRTS